MIKKLVPAEFPRGASGRGTSRVLKAKAYITGSVNEDLLRRIEYLLEPSSILPFVNDEERELSLWVRGDGRHLAEFDFRTVCRGGGSHGVSAGVPVVETIAAYRMANHRVSAPPVIVEIPMHESAPRHWRHF